MSTIINGTKKNDIIDNLGIDAQIYADSGYDTVYYYGAESLIDGGASADILRLKRAVNVDLNAADQTIGDSTNVKNFESVDASAVTTSVSITGTSGINTLTGGTGDDFISGGGGADILVGGDGNDRIVITGQERKASGGNGLDTLIFAANATIMEVNLSNVADQTTGDATIVSSFDNVDASNVGHNINITGNKHSNNLIGTIGDDLIDGGAGNDTLTGGAGNDTFVFNANFGRDVISDFSSGDKIDFKGQFANFAQLMKSSKQVGNDVLISFDANNSVTLKNKTLSSLIAADFGMPTYNYIYGTAGNDKIYGTTGADWIEAGAGSNIIYSNGGADIIYGGKGHDHIVSAAVYNWDVNQIIYNGGADVIYAGGGYDDYDDVFASGLESLIVGDSNDTLYFAKLKQSDMTTYILPIETPSSITEIDFNNDFDQTIGDDTIVRGFGRITLYLPQDLSIIGDEGANHIYSGRGNDTIYGGGGNDRIYAGAGADYIDGDAGNDWIVGGVGNDTFVFDYYTGHDIVTDYSGGEQADKIRFINAFADWNELLSKTQQVGNDTVITYDANNSITLQNVQVSSLKQENFTFS